MIGSGGPAPGGARGPGRRAREEEGGGRGTGGASRGGAGEAAGPVLWVAGRGGALGGERGGGARAKKVLTSEGGG
ncbi:MAG: hypothetical protein MPW13_02080 [Candidatus Manganitrophus sp.]|nr:hypothetical protein [Candidatus Manganitrophus sp.]